MPRSRLRFSAVGFGPFWALLVLALVATPGDGQAGAATDPATPQCETAGSGFAPLLRWSTGIVYIQPPTYQYHLQLVPFQNAGPGIDLIHTKGRADPESFQVEPPPRWYGLLPDLSYTWRVRLSDATTPIGSQDPSWGAWSGWCGHRTPRVDSATISLASPADGETVQSLTPAPQWANTNTEVFYYEIQISKDQTFTTDPDRATAAVYWNLVHGGASSPANSYAVPSSAPLEPAATYYWRVRPRVQGDGIPVPWTPTIRFTTPALRTVTLADDGTTISFLVGERFQLDLGTAYQWTVRVDDETIVALLPTMGPRAMPLLFETKQLGHTTLSAVGDLPCRQAQPPCLAPSRLFKIQLVVQNPPVVGVTGTQPS